MKKFTLFLATAFCFSLMLTSCGKDVCYDCTSGSDTQSLCEGDVDTATNESATKAQVEAAVLLLEGFGYDCTKQ